MNKIEQLAQELINWCGEQDNPGTKETHKRFYKAWEFMTSGCRTDIVSLFTTFEKGDYDQMVLLKNIELYSMCEHHLLPFIGKAHVAYIPGTKIVGISKLARLVDAYSRRLQIQERIGEQVTQALMDYLQPVGAACIIEAQHLCMQMRGVKKQNSVMQTSSLKGVFLQQNERGVAARNELMLMIK